MLDLAAVNQVLSSVIDPNTGRDFVSSRAARNVRIEGARVSLDVELGYPAASQVGLIRDLIATALKQAGAAEVEVSVASKIVPHTVQRGLKVLPNVRNIVAVYSGKGGVGKSTVAANLALALAAEGARVGMLDADIYGPSQPQMMGLAGHKPQSVDGKHITPLLAHGVEVMSIGFMIDPEQPMAWRGPMVTQALTQLLGDTEWGELDYLVVDMPPGTGDIQLTLAQRVPVSGAVIVTTPQDIALLDARKGLKMFEKVEVRVLGVVENMSVHVCSNCGHIEHVFGSGGGARMAQQYGVQLLGELPLDIRIREEADGGSPTVVAEPGSARARAYLQMARRAAARLATLNKDYSSMFPKITVEAT